MTMTLIKELIRRARYQPPPAVLFIEEYEVMPLAYHSAAITHQKADVKDIADRIRAGKMKFYNIPVRTR